MARTAAEIEADITTINSALQDLRQGERVTKLELGSGEFARVYHFQQITYENLKEELTNLYSELEAIQAANSDMVFRKSSHMELVVKKFPRLG